MLEKVKGDFFELGIASNFSFLRGASHPEELVVMAAKLGLAGIAICDRNTLAGLVRAHMAAKEAGLRFQPGCRIAFQDNTPDCLLWPKNISGWNNLCQLLTTGNIRAPKGECFLALDDLLEWGDDMALALIPAAPFETDNVLEKLKILKARFNADLRLALASDYSTTAERNMAQLAECAATSDMPLLATNNVLYHRAERHRLCDVVTCIREHVTLAKAGRLLQPNAERHLKPADEMQRLFRRYPKAIEESRKLFNELSFSLDELRYQYPDETPKSGLSQRQELKRLAYQGAEERYPSGPPRRVLDQIAHELKLIGQLKYEPYFLTVHDIVRFARSQGILCQGRGSAANSTVCYCIKITDVDPTLADLLFERFISPERREPPDIDVDFEHERREEVIQYIYEKYGRYHSGLAATVVTYRSRSAAREVGKVFGLSEDSITALSSAVWGYSSKDVGKREADQSGLDVNDITISQVLEMASEINGFPRHLSQHVGGFVITRDRLDTIMPVMNTAMEGRTMVEWDKDDLESLGILKIDILALGMLTCLRKCFDLLESHYERPLTLATMPKEDARTYAMIQRADTIGVFQIESRAQMSMLPRLKPASFYDLVIEVAIVRPGPIQGDMVHPYLRRRQGKEAVSYPSKDLEDVLGRTLGVPLFQEQAMKIAIVAAGFSPGEADKLRRAMATFRRVGAIHTFREKMVEGMAARGYDREFAARCFKQIEGFGEYGFPESHAASFALLVYASCWLKCHYPDVFCAAILNSQPMGFYSAAQLVRDAREHGVEMRAADINLSNYDCTLEPLEARGNLQSKLHPKIHPRHAEMKNDIHTNYAVRLGLRQIKGINEQEAHLLEELRGQGYKSVRDLWLRTGLSRGTIEKLAEADAFCSIGLDRRKALWQVRALDNVKTGDTMPLFDHLLPVKNLPQPDLQRSGFAEDPQNEPETILPQMPASEHVIQDYRSMSLSLKAHPVSFLREKLARNRIVTTASFETTPSGRWLEIAGLVVVRQRPGTAKGVVFMTIEDETGIAIAIVWPKVFEKYRPLVMGARLICIYGKLQKADGVTHLIAHRLSDATPMLAAITEQGIFASQYSQYSMNEAQIEIDSLANADEVRQPVDDGRGDLKTRRNFSRLLKKQPDTRRELKETAKVMPKGRNFH